MPKEFNRPPRISNSLQKAVVKIPEPINNLSKPSINWLAIGLPVVFIGIFIALMLVFSPSGMSTSYLLFLPFMLISGIVTSVTYLVQRKRYKKDLQETKERFTKDILDFGKDLEKINSQQKKTLDANDPDLQNCIKWAEAQNIHLGQRRRKDPDYLAFRVGKKDKPANISFEAGAKDSEINEFKEHFSTIQAYIEKHEKLSNAPFIIDLKQLGHIGIYGKSEQLLSQLLSAGLVQLFTQHWPADISVIAISPLSRSSNWLWLDTILYRPEFLAEGTSCIMAQDSFSQTYEEQYTKLEEELRNRLADRRESIGEAKEDNTSFNPIEKFPALIVLFDHVPNLYDQAAFSLLLNEGHLVNAHGIFLVTDKKEIPGECRAVLSISNNNLSVEFVANKSEFEIVPDLCPAKDFDKFIKAIAKIDWLIPSIASEPPNYISLRELFSVTNFDDLPVEKWWDGEHPFGYLKTPVGKFSPTESFLLDLNQVSHYPDAHGPHGIIGGTTGSGKSELLRTVILSYALTHSPYDINFALIDYKGGSAFMGLEKLPHVSGVITDIEGHADNASRVLLYLEAEIKLREKLMVEAQDQWGVIPDIDYYRLLPVKKPLPRLIIIFDEFAEFKELHPEECRKLIGFARKGRSLGIHLILCTQNPSSAVDNQIKQNITSRICLRVNSKQDSKDLIDIPDAKHLKTGKAFFYVDVPKKFQTAYTGDKCYLDDTIVAIAADGSRRIVYTPIKNKSNNFHQGLTEADLIIKRITKANKNLGLPKPSKVWPESLPETISLTQLYEKHAINPLLGNKGVTESHFIMGIYDNPSIQAQPLLYFNDKGKRGHILAIGAQGTGKSTLLHTIVTSTAYMSTPDKYWIYCVDFSGQKSFDIFNQLPFFPKEGGVIDFQDEERCNRLFAMLRQEIRSRREQFRDKRVNNISNYNAIANSTPIPEILLIVHNIKNEAINSFAPSFATQLAEIAQGGKSAGIQIVLTASLLREIPAKLFSLFANDADTTMLYLGKGEPDQISSIVGRIKKEYIESIEFPAGRGLMRAAKPLPFQIAMPVRTNEENFMEDLAALYTQMAQSWNSHKRAPSIEVLPTFVSSNNFQLQNPDSIKWETEQPLYQLPIGISQASLNLTGLDLDNDGPTYLITSTDAKLGKTCLIQSMLLYLAKNYSPAKVKFFILDFVTHSLKDFRKLPHTFQHVRLLDELSPALEALKSEITRRRLALEKLVRSDDGFDAHKFFEEEGLLFIVIDNFGSLRGKLQDPNDYILFKDIFQKGEKYGIRAIIAETASKLGTGKIEEYARATGCGIALGGGGARISGNRSLDDFNNAKLPYGQLKSSLPAGQGYLVRNGKAQLVQTFAYWETENDDQATRTQLLKQMILDIKKQYPDFESLD